MFLCLVLTCSSLGFESSLCLLAWIGLKLTCILAVFFTRPVFSLVFFSALLCVSFSATLRRYLGVKTVVITAATVCLSCSHCSWTLACAWCHRFECTICSVSLVFPLPQLCFPWVCNFFQTAFGNVRCQCSLVPCHAMVPEFVSLSLGLSSLGKGLASTDPGLFLRCAGGCTAFCWVRSLPGLFNFLLLG